MDPTKQFAALTRPLAKLPPTTRWALIGAAVLVVAAAAFSSTFSSGDHYQYAFTNLGTEDASEIAEQLKGAGIPFRAEAGGAAVAVPADKVYDARLLLASVGLPRGGGVGFELFDRGDLGVSEFTQKVNLRRAIEGELARTIGHLAEVRSARVHLSFEEKTLFRDDDRKAAAAVVINVQPGRTLGDREIAGIRHLVASSVTGLSPEAVTLVDGRGRALTTDANEQAGHQSGDLEHSLEQRVVSLLETVAGTGAVVARVTATVDDTEVTTNSEVFDPDSAALRSEHKSNQSQTGETGSPSNLAGAAANQPLPQTPPPSALSASKNGSNSEDQQRSYELSKTVTRTVKHSPKLVRLSAAILVDGVGGKPQSADEMTKLGELAKKAIGFDAARGDVLEISSEVFAHSTEDAAGAAAATPAAELASKLDHYKWIAAGVGGFLLLAGLGFALTRRRGPAQAGETLTLSPGATVAQLEQRMQPMAPTLAAPALPDPAIHNRSRALEIAKKDPARAAHLIRAWIASDNESSGANNG